MKNNSLIINIQELLDSPVDYKQIVGRAIVDKYAFDIDNKSYRMHVLKYFSLKKYLCIDISFAFIGEKDSFNKSPQFVTNFNDIKLASKVYATVLSICWASVKRLNPYVITFSSVEKDQNKIYRRLIKRYIASTGYRRYTFGHEDSSLILIAKHPEDVPEDVDIKDIIVDVLHNRVKYLSNRSFKTSLKVAKHLADKSEGFLGLTPGVKKAMGKHSSPGKCSCSNCGCSVPKYGGRYPQACYFCGGGLTLGPKGVPPAAISSGGVPVSEDKWDIDNFGKYWDKISMEERVKFYNRKEKNSRVLECFRFTLAKNSWGDFSLRDRATLTNIANETYFKNTGR